LFYAATGYVRIGMLFAVIAGACKVLPAIFDPLRFLAGMRLGTSGTVFLIVEVVLFAPIAEEFLFRGFLLPRLAAQVGPTWALAWTALTFASLHQSQGIYMIAIAFTGLVLGWARLRTGGLLVPILLHALQNAWATFLMLRR
jgi:membrane protease YdiL (CAAX protease family)